MIPNIVSLTYLGICNPLDSDLPVLTNIVQSHRTLKVLDIGPIEDCDALPTNMLQLIEAAGNSQLTELRLYPSDYDKLPLHIHKFYEHLLKPSRYLGLL